MKTVEQTGMDDWWQQCSLPVNLSEWIGKDMLVKLALNAVQSVEDHRIDRDIQAGVMMFLPPRMMLTLLAYCYAVGIYGSRAIHEQIHHDAALRYLCAGQHPSADYIRRFRNKNREVITSCLGRVCCAVGRMHLAGQGTALLDSEPRAGLPSNWFGYLMELQCLCEARQRLTLAELMDGLWTEMEFSTEL